MCSGSISDQLPFHPSPPALETVSCDSCADTAVFPLLLNTYSCLSVGCYRNYCKYRSPKLPHNSVRAFPRAGWESRGLGMVGITQNNRQSLGLSCGTILHQCSIFHCGQDGNQETKQIMEALPIEPWDRTPTRWMRISWSFLGGSGAHSEWAEPLWSLGMSSLG